MSVRARVEELSFSYGRRGALALDRVSLEIRAGEVVLLQGPSGGGKSTLLRALAGLVPHFHGGRFSGRVIVDGLDTRRASPAAISDVAGALFQDPEAQTVLQTVERDVAFGPQNAGLPAAAVAAEVDRALAVMGAEALRGRRIDTLSGGERQRVALAGVLARRPRLLLLDEPTSQLDESGARELMSMLRLLTEREGVAVAMAEHRADRAALAADRTLRVESGRLREGEPPVPALTSAPARPASPRVDGTALAEARELHLALGGREVLRGASLSLPAGTVTAISGPNGSGKSTLLRALAGLARPDAGAVLLAGALVTAVPAERRFPRIGLVVQDPGRHLLCERVDEELAFGLRQLGTPAGERARRVAETLRALEIAALAERHPLDLSVGERERVALGAMLAAAPDVIALDEPTRGMDSAKRALLADLLRAHAAAGRAALVATHDAAFAGAVADRHARLVEGRVELGSAASETLRATSPRAADRAPLAPARR